MDAATPPVRSACGSCRHFRNDAAYVEAALAGLTSLSSARGSTRCDDGICLLHGRYLSARSLCRDFSPVGADAGAAGASGGLSETTTPPPQ